MCFSSRDIRYGTEIYKQISPYRLVYTSIHELRRLTPIQVGIRLQTRIPVKLASRVAIVNALLYFKSLLLRGLV